MAKEIVKATASSVEGLKVKCEARGFSMMLDEPKDVGGSDTAMNPIECLLCSLGGCKVIVAKLFAEANGIKLKDVKIEFEGTFDFDGIMGKNPDARIGYSKITTKYYFDADNTIEELEKFAGFIDKHCPVADTIANGTEFVHEINKM